jgi:hypothetical protein
MLKCAIWRDPGHITQYRPTSLLSPRFWLTVRNSREMVFGILFQTSCNVPKSLHWTLCRRSSENVVFWTSPEASNIIRAEGASHPSNHPE